MSTIKACILRFELIITIRFIVSQSCHASGDMDGVRITRYYLDFCLLSTASMHRKQALRRQWVMKRCQWKWNMCAASSLAHILTKMQTSSGVMLLHVHPSILTSQLGSFAIVYMCCFVMATPMHCGTHIAMLAALRTQDNTLWVIKFCSTVLLLKIMGISSRLHESQMSLSGVFFELWLSISHIFKIKILSIYAEYKLKIPVLHYFSHCWPHYFVLPVAAPDAWLWAAHQEILWIVGC